MVWSVLIFFLVHSLSHVRSARLLILSKTKTTGTLYVSLASSANSMTFASMFHNSGTVVANTGALILSADGTHAGIFSHTAFGSIRFGGGVHTLSATSVVNAGNGIWFTGGTIGISGAFYPTTFVHSGSAKATFNIPYTTTSPVSVTGGTLAFAVGASFESLTIQTGIVDFRSSSSISNLVLQGSTGGKIYVTGALTAVNVASSLQVYSVSASALVVTCQC